VTCGEHWLRNTEVSCTREPHATGEHAARIEIQYDFEQTGIVDISWKGEADAYGTRVPQAEKDSA
jgi:hypothetical protein